MPPPVRVKCHLVPEHNGPFGSFADEGPGFRTTWSLAVHFMNAHRASAVEAVTWAAARLEEAIDEREKAYEVTLDQQAAGWQAFSDELSKEAE